MRRAVALVMVATVPLLEPFHAFSAYWLSRNQNGPAVLARGCALAMRVAVVLVALWAGAQAWVVALAWVAEAMVSATLQSVNLRSVKPWGALARAVRASRAQRYARFGIRFAAGLWLSHLFLRIDRMWLAERMDPHAFGLYATAMQLVDVWLQVASLLAGSMAPAFLYRALRQSSALRDHWRTLAGLTVTGLAGLAGAALIGPWLLADVFGPAFRAAQGYLLAGFAAATLFFIDQFVHISITANARPWLLAAKWGAACATAVATLLLAVPKLGAYAGPLGLALGLVAGWCVVGVVRWGERYRARERT
jgi:PST family polysaccharide transporter